VTTHHPEAPLSRIKGEPPPDGQRLDHLVGAEVFGAEEAGGVDAGYSSLSDDR